MPAVSVIVPAYNHEAYVDEAMASISGQTFGDLEILAADDGSTDGTFERLEYWADKDPRVRLLRHPDRGNHGLKATLELCFDASSAPVIAAVASDDRWRPCRLERQLAPTIAAGWSYCMAQYMDNEGRCFGTEDRGRLLTGPGESAFEKLLEGNRLVAPTVMYTRDFYDEVGGFGDALFEDWQLWLKFASRREPAFVAEALVEYRTSLGGIYRRSRTAGFDLEGAVQVLDGLLSDPSPLAEVHKPLVESWRRAYESLRCGMEQPSVDAGGLFPEDIPRLRLLADQHMSHIARNHGVLRTLVRPRPSWHLENVPPAGQPDLHRIKLAKRILKEFVFRDESKAAPRALRLLAKVSRSLAGLGRGC